MREDYGGKDFTPILATKSEGIPRDWTREVMRLCAGIHERQDTGGMGRPYAQGQVLTPALTGDGFLHAREGMGPIREDTGGKTSPPS